jgi:hypothetical protein
MRRHFVIFVFTIISLTQFMDAAQSCGDKFLVIGRGIRYERAHAAKHPASILIFASNPDSVKDLQKILKMAGHKIQNVTTQELLFSSLNSARYDIVLVSLSDASALESRIMTTSNKPAVLPVVYNKGNPDLDANANQFPCVLKYKDKNRNPVVVIDQVMDDRLKGKPMECKWNKKA